MAFLLRSSFCAYQKFTFTSFNPKIRFFSSSEFDNAINKAERVVGYPVSFADPGYILKSEIPEFADLLIKSTNSGHPVFNTATHILSKDKYKSTWGLIIMLISKAIGNSGDNTFTETVYQNQKTLAEIAEMIRTADMIHNGMVNLNESACVEHREDLFSGNKIALLTGDYLLAKANLTLSNMRNQHLTYLMSCAIRDLSDSKFVGERDDQNMPLPSKPLKWYDDIKFDVDDVVINNLMRSARQYEPIETVKYMGDPVQEWSMRNFLNSASLLAKTCEGVMYLAKQDIEVQNNAYHLGNHMELAWQALVDYNSIINPQSKSFSLVSAPVLFALNEDSSLYDYIEIGRSNVDFVDFDRLRTLIMKGQGLNFTLNLLQKHKNAALKHLNDFRERNAINGLRKIILSYESLRLNYY